MNLIVIYSGDFGERVIGNLINYSTFCISCAEACTQCKEGKYGFADRINGFFKLPAPSLLPLFIEDSTSGYLPNEIPDADIAIVSEIHNDILLELPIILKDSGIKAMIVPQESAAQLARPQIEELCAREEVEIVFPKPFCDLQPQDDKPMIKNFVKEMGWNEVTKEGIMPSGCYENIHTLADFIRELLEWSKLYATALSLKEDNTVIVLHNGRNMVCVCGKDAIRKGYKANEYIKKYGKGGGNEEMAQGVKI